MQRDDSGYDWHAKRIVYGDSTFSINEQGQIRYGGRIWLPSNDQLKNEILADLHNYRFTIHPGGMKMFREAKHQFWSPNKKKDIVKFMARYLICQ